MQRMRADLESFPARSAAAWLEPVTAPPTRTIVEDLRELIAALDRRVPRGERKGETDIARDAAALRDEAVARIASEGTGTTCKRSCRP
jgi:hypothetical protein